MTVRAAITRAEVRRILHQARHGYRLSSVRFRLALWFLFETGARTAEVFAIGWENYDDHRGCFELDGAITKTGEKRLIVLSKRAWRLIRWLRRHDARASGPVFLNAQGTPWERCTFGAMFRGIADLAAVRSMSTYSLRRP